MPDWDITLLRKFDRGPDVSDRLMKHGFPLPRGGDRHVVEADFDDLIEAVRRASGVAVQSPRGR